MNKNKWLNDSVFYNIYPQSFNDTNGDGIGDLNGITEKLGYIKEMGFNGIWLNPIYKSSFRDAGYDVIDFYKVDPRYGSNTDFEKLTMEAKKGELKLFLIWWQDILLWSVNGFSSQQCRNTTNIQTDIYGQIPFGIQMIITGSLYAVIRIVMAVI